MLPLSSAYAEIFAMAHAAGIKITAKFFYQLINRLIYLFLLINTRVAVEAAAIIKKPMDINLAFGGNRIQSMLRTIREL